ncbi:hypothetical protein AMS68_004425 [Peltaster fructicola]|uniref:Cullin family profile domain-containing protein n=1 Tax=Peltaster fructicola TaxID=286661 RepID=A0A6H0XWD2_9PEZI|nr:hypothetical protein AMS68_004425 [Peltaster fructicola]
MASLATRNRGKIRPPKRGLNNADLDFESTWAVLERAFREIHTKNASALSFEELYRNAYKIVLKKKGEELYTQVIRFEERWLAEQVRSDIVKLLTPALLMSGMGSSTSATPAEQRVAGEMFLRALKQAWEDHQLCMGMLTDVLMYMDRVYCTDHRQPSIFAKSMSIFRDQILRTPARSNMATLLEILTSIVLDQIQMDRAGEKIDQYLIKSNIYMLEGLYENEREAEDDKLYLTRFEQEFLDTSQNFYREESERLLKDSDAGAYCSHVKRRIQEENDRCRSTLSESTTSKIQKVVEDEMIRHKISNLIDMESGVKYMVDNDQMQQLGDIYDLEARVDPKKQELTKALQRIITEKGTNVNNAAIAASQALPGASSEEPTDDKAEEKPTAAKATNNQTVAALKWVEDVLTLKDQSDQIWAQAFGSDQTLQVAFNRSMGDVINSFSRGSEYISLFIDENMKKGIRNKTEAEIDATLEKAIVLLRFLQDKDYFENYYKKHLCKRLLLNRSQSIDVEKQMISRMKIELGNSFTLKLEAMFKDMTLSEEYSTGYKQYVARLGDADPRRVDLNVRVLTSMTWPLEAFRGGASLDEEEGARPKVIFPQAIERIRHGFERFYAEKHSGRRLTWMSNMGDVDLKATFPKGSKEGKSQEIQAQTNIPLPDLNRNLQSLAVAQKTRFLIKEPMSREISLNDKFSFNENFKSPFVRIKVNVVAAGNKVEGDRERKETEKKNNDSRGFAVEAAVVRIMKQRKELSHTALINETIAQLVVRFKPDVNMIKKRIESLIEREYLERIEDAPVPSYRYLA